MNQLKIIGKTRITWLFLLTLKKLSRYHPFCSISLQLTPQTGSLFLAHLCLYQNALVFSAAYFSFFILLIYPQPSHCCLSPTSFISCAFTIYKMLVTFQYQIVTQLSLISPPIEKKCFCCKPLQPFFFSLCVLVSTDAFLIRQYCIMLSLTMRLCFCLSLFFMHFQLLLYCCCKILL